MGVHYVFSITVTWMFDRIQLKKHVALFGSIGQYMFWQETSQKHRKCLWRCWKHSNQKTFHWNSSWPGYENPPSTVPYLTMELRGFTVSTLELWYAEGLPWRFFSSTWNQGEIQRNVERFQLNIWIWPIVRQLFLIFICKILMASSKCSTKNLVEFGRLYPTLSQILRSASRKSTSFEGLLLTMAQSQS